MYGLSSRAALSTRQSRWIQDVDKESNQKHPPTPIQKRSNIISLIAEPHDQSEEKLVTLQKDYETLNERLSKLEEDYNSLKQTIDTVLNQDVKEISTNEFVPFVIKEDYAGRDNLTTLKDGHLKMVVELIGILNEPLIIYPFGLETKLPNLPDCTVNITSDKYPPVLAQFKKREDGVYIIEMDEIENCTYPLIFHCEETLK